MNKKIVLKLGTITTGISFISLSAACSSKMNEHPIPEEKKVTDKNMLPTTKLNPVELNDKFKLDATAKANAKKIVMIQYEDVAEGSEFNKLAWNGIKEFAQKQNNLDPSLYQLLSVKNNNFEELYKKALDEDYKIWVLSGIEHSEHFENFFKNSENLKKAQEKGIKIIQLGFDEQANINGAIISQIYNVKEAAFNAGYAAAEFLSHETPENRTFGIIGADSQPSTVGHYAEGFMKGVIYWNQKPENKDKKIKIASQQPIFNATYQSGQKMDKAIEKLMKTNPKLILSIIGDSINELLKHKEIATKYIIGVNEDYSVGEVAKNKLFLTSILKTPGQGVYNIIGLLSTTNGDLEKIYTNNDVKAILGKKDGQRFSKYGSFSDKLVGLAKPNLADRTKNELAESAIKKAEKMWAEISESDKTWIDTPKAINDENSEILNDFTRLYREMANVLK
ncbi:hypothetical protein MCAL160_0526 [Mycoplasmopsis californica HAZ160_1]|uniref:ABC transporter substrate-binding protein PnrA-like domain-containing protein n=1 Tax=Mycoplasmopsis californica HAZ160_1 TaxID=1397850 RepID=A0AAT9F8D9_9BACT|nr:BMP family ABC transporter substrate-binding protein [Mycoplasmopsis californica]BAP01069.1 hypothetical protein MCAL160_0526 [Mycoplasmopsis californica HAZ160_1]BBG40933.1 hypothetical protein MCAL106_0526 [Mycoplasmopsis californica]BBG41527.1 hypothetical protein MCAL106E_0526 [Mycoplasmopsis californica]BBG42120.1 hypothetical protein MCAL106L_0526 [Mycoplasmopsis californica]BBG42704.1 hypothetical protein MCAL160E_0526 [Mycoplasmopsis californica]